MNNYNIRTDLTIKKFQVYADLNAQDQNNLAMEMSYLAIFLERTLTK